MKTFTRLCSVAASFALFLAFPGIITLGCLVATGVVAVVDTIVADLEADAK